MRNRTQIRVNWRNGNVTGLTSINLYHGDSRGGARARYGIDKPDIPAFYATPHLEFAQMFTREYATVPGGDVTVHRLRPSARVVHEDFITDALDWQESAGLKHLPGHKAVAARAHQLGFDAIHRQRGAYRAGGRWKRGHEVFVINMEAIEQTGLVEVGSETARDA